MGSYSHPLFSQNGLRCFPQTLFLLLRTCLAGPSYHPGLVAYTDLSPWQSIRHSVFDLVDLLNPFSRRQDSFALTWVGMVKLTALCGFGSAVWIWSKRNGEGRRSASLDDSIHSTEADDIGKSSRSAFRDARRIPDTLSPIPAPVTMHTLDDIHMTSYS